MSAPTNHWKLGLFVVTGGVAAVVSVLSFSAYRMRSETIAYKTYFDETVQGLEIGSPVKFRGVSIGAVSDIAVSPDRRHVEVTSSLVMKEVTRLGLGRKGDTLGFAVPPELRAQLAAIGITGVKFVQIDFFDVTSNPPPALPFAPATNYIPAAVSTLKNLEDAILLATERLPVIADQLLAVMNRVAHILQEVDDQQLPSKAVDALARVNELVATLDSSLKKLDPAGLSKSAKETIARANAAATKLSAMLDRIGGDKGLLVSAKRATDAMGDVGRGATSVGGDLQKTLQSMEQAADAIARLTEAIERDPDMLLKGRSRRKGAP